VTAATSRVCIVTPGTSAEIRAALSAAGFRLVERALEPERDEQRRYLLEDISRLLELAHLAAFPVHLAEVKRQLIVLLKVDELEAERNPDPEPGGSVAHLWCPECSGAGCASCGWSRHRDDCL
jgi:hypothetical protein